MRRDPACHTLLPTPARPEGADSAAPDKPSDWLVWQLIDSAFPTGSFAHSAGLEAAWQHGEVRNRIELQSFLKANLDQMAQAALPLVLAAFDTPSELSRLDEYCDVFTTNHVANRASRAQGRAFLAAVERVFKPAGAESTPAPSFAHYAPVFGACLQRVGMPRETVARMFGFNHLRGLLAAAVRLNIVGPMESQVLQHGLSATLESALQRGARLTLAEMSQPSPLLDLWQGAQDRLYSRLFQS